MTIEEKLDAISAQLATVIDLLNAGRAPAATTGGRGDGGKPVDTNPPPTPKLPSNIPNIPGMTPTPIIDAPPSSGAPASPPGDGGGYGRLTFDFRDGDILRFVGSGVRSVGATHAALIRFSIGDSGGNNAREWNIVVRKNGQPIHDSTVSTYQVVPENGVRVEKGDLVMLEIYGDGLVVSARLEIAP